MRVKVNGNAGRRDSAAARGTDGTEIFGKYPIGFLIRVFPEIGFHRVRVWQMAGFHGAHRSFR